MTKNKHLGRDVIEISRKLKKKRKYELTWPIPEKWPAPDKQEDSRERRRGLSEARAREGISSKWSIRKKKKEAELTRIWEDLWKMSGLPAAPFERKSAQGGGRLCESRK